MQKPLSNLFVNTVTAILIFIFTYTAISKLVDWNTSIAFLKKSPFSPIAEQLALLLPAAELFIAVLLIVPSARLKGLYASFIIMIAFTLYIIYMLLFYPGRPCNCGGVINTMSWESHIVFNVAIIVLTALAIKWHRIQKVDQPGAAENPLTE